jgi:hypothetical protein
MKIDPITEASTPTQACLIVPLDSCSGHVQLTAERKAATRVETSSFEEKTDCSLALCPQGSDCAGESVPGRLFDCEQGCGFRGCGACMEIHESEPHASDSDVRLAMVRSIGGSWCG